MKKRLLPLLLVLAMVLAMMAGCGSSDSAEESSSSSTAAEETEETEEAEKAEEAEEAEETAASGSTVTYPICEPGEITLSFWMQWPPFLNGQYEPADVPFFGAMEEATGISLDIVYCSTEDVDTQLSLLAASDSFYDLMSSAANNYTGGGTKAIEDEMLIDIYPYMEENMPNYWSYMQDPAVSKFIINDQGYVPMLSGIYTDYYYTDQGLWVRQDWLDELGIDTPETLDDFTEMLRTFQSEKGATDSLTVLSGGTVGALAATFNTSVEGIVVYDGETQYGPIQDGTREYLTYMHQLYEEGLISTDFPSYTESATKPPEDIVLNGMTGVFVEDVASVPSYTNVVEGMDLKALAAPVQNAGDKLDTQPYACLVSSQYNISISTKCEYVEEALQYIDYLFTDEGRILANYGIEGTCYTMENGVPTFTDMILNDPQGFQVSLLINICPGFIRMIDWNVTYLTYDDRQREAVDIWMSVYNSSDCTFPNDYVTYTSDESELMAEISSDLSTYCEECRLKFITGDMDIETEWDSYVADVENMRLDELMEVYQGAYERFMAK